MKSIADWHAVLTRSDPCCRSVDEAERLAQPESFDHLHLLAESYDQVRRYAPVLLETFDFRAAPAVAHLMAAINTLRVMTPAKLADEIFAVGSPLRTLPAAPPEFLNTIQYPNLAPNLYELHGVVSRKKQLLPYLLDCL